MTPSDTLESFVADAFGTAPDLLATADATDAAETPPTEPAEAAPETAPETPPEAAPEQSDAPASAEK